MIGELTISDMSLLFDLTVGGGWLADMVGTKDTGGSKDTFAGNGKKIDGFRVRRV